MAKQQHPDESRGLVIIRDRQVIRWQTWAISGSYPYSPIKVMRLPEGQGFLCLKWDGINGEKAYNGQTAREAIYAALSRKERRGLPIVRIFNHPVTREKVEELFPKFEVVDLDRTYTKRT